MWSIDPNTSAISMHRGDTGAYYVTVSKADGSSFDDGDVAIYEVKQGDTVKIHREFNLNPSEPNDFELGNGKFLIDFKNSDTDSWAIGSYNTEIRVVCNPIREVKSSFYIFENPFEHQTDHLTGTFDPQVCITEYGEKGTVYFYYTGEEWWSALPPSEYGITLVGTPKQGDILFIEWDNSATQKVVDGDVVRTIQKSKSTITILDTMINV